MPATLSDPKSAAVPADALPERMYSDHDVAKLFGVSAVTVRRWLKAGILPRPVVIRCRRYWHPHSLAQLVCQR
jgi:DNA-binding transcriptional MerR regulator